MNGTGIPDPGDTGIFGVHLILFEDTNGNGVYDSGEPQVGYVEMEAVISLEMEVVTFLEMEAVTFLEMEAAYVETVFRWSDSKF